MKKNDINPTAGLTAALLEMESTENNIAVANSMVHMLYDLMAPIKICHVAQISTLTDEQVNILRTALEMYVDIEDERLLTMAKGVAECYKSLEEGK